MTKWATIIYRLVSGPESTQNLPNHKYRPPSQSFNYNTYYVKKVAWVSMYLK